MLYGQDGGTAAPADVDGRRTAVVGNLAAQMSGALVLVFEGALQTDIAACGYSQYLSPYLKTGM